MAILAECPVCHRKQSSKNKLCACGMNMDRAKKSRKVRYWISYRLPNSKQKRESVDAFKDLNGYSIEDARRAESKRVDRFGSNSINSNQVRIFKMWVLFTCICQLLSTP